MKPILNLTIKRKWLDMIVNRQKREEYRAWDNARVGNFWKRCIETDFPSHSVIVLRAGYRMDSPAAIVGCYGLTVRGAKECFHPEWGEPNGVGHFALLLGPFVRFGPYSELKKWMEDR